MSKLISNSKDNLRLKASQGKASEFNEELNRLVRSPGYKLLKVVAAQMCAPYRPIPGNNEAEEISFLNYAKRQSAYQALFNAVETKAGSVAQKEQEEDADQGWQ